MYEFRNPNFATRGVNDDGDELNDSNQKSTRSERFNKKIKGMISEMLASEEKDSHVVDDSLKTYIRSVVDSKAKDTITTVSSTNASEPSITSILKSNLK